MERHRLKHDIDSTDIDKRPKLRDADGQWLVAGAADPENTIHPNGNCDTGQ
jgi:hypothetical protein